MAANPGISPFPVFAPAAARAQTRVQVQRAVNPFVRAALYFFVLSIPFELPKIAIPLEVPTLTGGLFLLATLVQPSTSYRRIPGAVLWFTVYLWMFGLSTLVNRSTHTDLVVPLFLLMLQLVLLLWATSNLLRDPRVMRGVLITLAMAVALRAGLQVLGIGATAKEVWTGGERVSAFGQNPNLASIIMGVGAVMLVNLRPRLITWPAAAMVAFAVIQTGSRGGLACLAMGLLVWAIMSGRTFGAKLRGFGLGVFALGVLAFGVLRSDMLRTRLLAAEGGSLAGREHIYPAAIAMISERPLLGWGPLENQFEIATRIAEQKKDKRDAHNIVLDLLSSTGVLGTIPFLIGMGICLLSAWRARRGPYGSLPLAISSVTFVGCMSGTWIASKILWLTFAIALAAAAAAPRRAAYTREMPA
jgi:O-antigen ligase